MLDFGTKVLVGPWGHILCWTSWRSSLLPLEVIYHVGLHDGGHFHLSMWYIFLDFLMKVLVAPQDDILWWISWGRSLSLLEAISYVGLHKKVSCPPPLEAICYAGLYNEGHYLPLRRYLMLDFITKVFVAYRGNILYVGLHPSRPPGLCKWVDLVIIPKTYKQYPAPETWSQVLTEGSIDVSHERSKASPWGISVLSSRLHIAATEGLRLLRITQLSLEGRSVSLGGTKLMKHA